MKKILLAIIIFISASTITYSQCAKPTSVTITGPSTISICEGTALTLSGSATVDAASQNGGFTYSWRKVTPTITVIVPPTVVSITPNTNATIPSYIVGTTVIADAGTYVLRVEDGSVGNSACYTEASVVVTVNPKPTITGTLNVCEGSTTQLTASGIPFATTPWASATPVFATISIQGIVTGIAAGSSVITYINTNGCKQTAVVTVNPISTITGNLIVCNGYTSQLTGSGIPDATSPWISATTTVAPVSNSGVVTGVSAGTSVITYTTSSGCRQTVTVTVPASSYISGTLQVCLGLTTKLTGSGTAATTTAWTSASPTIATVDNTGLVTGLAVGTSIITYKNTTGCFQTATVTVNPIPTITGTLNICEGSTTQLTGTDMPNLTFNWLSSTTSVATASYTGIVTGVSAGTSTITYITNKGCRQTATVTVNRKPIITGILDICLGSNTQLTGSGTPAATNAWTSASPTIATVDNTGMVTGLAVGTSIITYKNNTDCIITTTVHVVNSTLAASVSITTNPGSTICSGTPVTFKANGTYGGTTPAYAWSSSVNGAIIISTTDTYTSSNLMDEEVISIIMTSSLSCAVPASAFNSITMHVVPSGISPSVSIMANVTNICANNPVVFTATIAGSGSTPAPTYEWFITSSLTASGNAISMGAPSTTATTFTTSALTATHNKVYAQVVSNAACATTTAVVSNVVSVTVNSGITAGTITSDQTICYNTVPAPLTQTTASDAITPAYTWEASLTGLGGSWNFIPSAGNGYTFPAVNLTQDVYIRRIVTDASVPAPCNVATSNTIHITVRPQLAAGTISSDEQICTGTAAATISETTATTGGAGVYNYQWESSVESGGPYSNIVSAINSSYSPGVLTYTTYFRRIETSGSCGSVTSNEIVKEIVSTILPTIHIDDPGATCNGDIVLFKCQATNVGLTPTYNWYVNNNLMVSNSPTPTSNNLIVPFKNGDEVWVELISNNTCANKSSVISNKVIVDLIPCTVSNSIYTTTNIDILLQPYVSNSIPNLIDYTYLWTITGGSTTTSVKGTSLSQSGIKLFPNPTTGSFNIEMPESGMDVTYEILDLTGLSVASGTFTSTGSNQNISTDLNAGMYQIVLKYNNVVTCVRLSKMQ